MQLYSSLKSLECYTQGYINLVGTSWECEQARCMTTFEDRAMIALQLYFYHLSHHHGQYPLASMSSPERVRCFYLIRFYSSPPVSQDDRQRGVKTDAPFFVAFCTAERSCSTKKGKSARAGTGHARRAGSRATTTVVVVARTFCNEHA